MINESTNEQRKLQGTIDSLIAEIKIREAENANLVKIIED
jgi:hypothetical protein